MFTAEAVLEGIGDSVFVVGLDGCLQLLNTASERLLGEGRHAWLGRSVLAVVHPDDVAALRHALAALSEGGAAPLLSLRVRDTNGDWRGFEAAAIGDPHSPEVQGLICVAQDITERRIREVASGDTSVFHQLVDLSPAMIVVVDSDGSVTRVSDSLLRHFELDRATVEGRPLACLAPLEDGESIVRAIERMRGHHPREVVEVAMHRSLPVSKPSPVRLEMVNLIDDPLVGGIVVTVDDLTELRAALAQAERAALYDQLTGLMNRQALLLELQRRLGSNEPFAALFINLDYFRPVNDLYGYQAGDELLVQVAQRLERSIRPHDLVARVGGDEFVVLVAGVDAATAAGLVEQLEMAVSAAYQLSAGSVRVGASTGVAVAEPDSTTVSLLADADAAMREVKAQRRGLARVSVFSRRTTSVERMQLVEECRDGLANKEFIAHFQPIIDLRTRRLVRIEALVRWQHQRLGLLRPQSFMSVIEAMGYDAELGNAVLDSACNALAVLARNGIHPDLAVNFAMGQLTDATLGRRVSGVMKSFAVDMSRLVVEITERALVGRRSTQGTVSPEDSLIELHHRGASLSLDDYGTGLSSLSNLRRFPLAEIKIDRSFVSQMCVSPQDRATVEVILGLARSLGLKAVAEGVETAEQLDLLTEMGCDQAQGYFVGVPMSVDDLIQWSWA